MKIINLVLFLSVAISFSGCILTHPGCIKSGKTGASECSRYVHRDDSIQKHKTELEKLNEDVDIAKFGKKLTDNEIRSIYNRFCKRYENKDLPVTKDLEANFKVDIGDYFEQIFCQTHVNKKELGLFEKETQTSTNFGYITWYITDGNKVYDYRVEPITYFKNGVVKYGIGNFSQ